MTFDTFLDLLVKIAAVLQPDAELRIAADSMIEKYFTPIYETIMKETIAGDISSLVRKEVDIEELRAFIGVVSCDNLGRAKSSASIRKLFPERIFQRR
jgi:hypothetical protein